MNKETDKIEAFFNEHNDQTTLLVELDKLITTTAPELKREIHEDEIIKVLGYGKGLNRKELKEKLPIISLGSQKNMVIIYLIAYKDSTSIVEKYKEKLGEVKCEFLTIKIKKLEDLNIEEFKNMIKETIEWNKE